MSSENMNEFDYIERMVTEDDRCKALRDGLEQLDDEDLARLDNHMDRSEPLVLDTFNYDARTGFWCPLAVGISVSRLLESDEISGDLDNERAKDVIRAEGRNKYGNFSLNPISGVSGDFYQKNRYDDLRRLVGYILNKRQ